MNYFTLHALAAEWNSWFSGSILVDCWTQSASELSLALQNGTEASTIRIHCDPRMALMFRAEGHGRARKNTATKFENSHGLVVEEIVTADWDRFVFIKLEDGSSFQIQLFGSRPNVFWIHGDVVHEAFLTNDVWADKPPPTTRPAQLVDTFEVFKERWRTDRKTLVQCVSAAIPVLDGQLAEEVVFRSELDPSASPIEATDGDLRRLLNIAVQFRLELRSPCPTVYWRGVFVETIALIPLQSVPEEWTPESFRSVDEALGVYAKRKLAQRRFMETFKPLEMALSGAQRKLARSAASMLSELQNQSRADSHEAQGHLLMALAADQPAGRDQISLPDILNDSADISIELDPALTPVENAQRFYAKSRQAREARRHAEDRYGSVQLRAVEVQRLLDRLRSLERFADLETFRTANKAALTQFARPEAVGDERLPYRRFEIHGWEIRVGKNAKSNAELTTKQSSPHDLWLHARGVAGSHVVIRRPNKKADIPKRVVEAAARIAAYFSDAKSQPLAPVIVTDRKYVRPVKGGAPGLVRVDREEVVMVEPGLPEWEGGDRERG